MPALTPKLCELCGNRPLSSPEPDPSQPQQPTSYVIIVGDQQRNVCEWCFVRHYRNFLVTTYCANCGGNAKAFYRHEWRELVIGCLKCDRRLQVIADYDFANLGDAKQAQIRALLFDYWENQP